MGPPHSKILVTTSNEDTWSQEFPMLFLGEWCLDYARKHVWENLDYELASPYALDIATRDKDFKQSRNLEEEIVPILVKMLNHIHGLDYKKRHWMLILGHWLRRYLVIVLNRYQTLKAAISNNLFIAYRSPGSIPIAR